eukprot:2549460-Rhodomonas_salina.1
MVLVALSPLLTLPNQINSCIRTPAATCSERRKDALGWSEERGTEGGQVGTRNVVLKEGIFVPLEERGTEGGRGGTRCGLYAHARGAAGTEPRSGTTRSVPSYALLRHLRY